MGVMEQSKVWGYTIAVRDLFTGALAETTREKMYLVNQIPCWIRGKITDVLQIADTHVNRPLKVVTAKKHEDLRKELQKLAQLEKTHAIFKCGTYETMRTILEVVIECKDDFEKNNKLLAAGIANGWLAIRPDFSDPEKPRFVKALDQEWAKEFKFGTHRLKQSWIDQRFHNLSADGMPQEIKLPCDKQGLPDEAEHEPSLPEGETKPMLSVWK